jgi:hypothetical protein
VELAEELGVRYGDSFRRAYGQAEETRRRTECTDSLFGQIAVKHSLTLEEVQSVRGERPRFLDLAVLTSFVVLYVLASRTFITAIHGTHPEISWIAIAALSLPVAVAALFALNLGGAVVEMIRWGDGHASYRGSRGLPWSHQWVAVVIGAALLFCCVALTVISFAVRALPAPSRPRRARVRIRVQRRARRRDEQYRRP